MFVAFSNVNFIFAPKVKKKKRIMAIYTILVYTAVQKTGLRECYDKIFWSTTFTAKPCCS